MRVLFTRTRGYAVAAALVGLVALTAPSVALAAPADAPADQRCAAGAVTQQDMAGTYSSWEHRMYVELMPCGGAYVQWDNAYGTHYAAYGTVQRVPSEGVIARRLPPNPDNFESLDSTEVIGFKAAEPGYIQVMTTNQYGDIVGVYRLAKLS
jgi:hypothetical protein